MFRPVPSRFFRNVLLVDVKRVDSTRSMAVVPKRAPVQNATLIDRIRHIKPKGYVFFTFPLATFALGVWQIKRSIWKGNLIEELESRLRRAPISLPETLQEISKLEYYPVKVRGQFDHSREILLGPRSLLNSTKPASTLLSDGSTAGFFVLTPFKPNDRDYYILVNRGWIPTSKKDPKTRLPGQIEGEVEFTGLIRLTEKRPTFVHHNDANANFWLYRDLDEMSLALGEDVAPISIDATADFTLPDGPIGGQTLINTKNTHYNYAITWLSLSLLSGVIWWQTHVPVTLRSVR